MTDAQSPRLDPLASPSERAAFVEVLRARIEQGAYQVEADDVARAIVEFHLGPEESPGDNK